LQIPLIAISIIFLSLIAVISLLPATVHITLADASGEILPTGFTDVFKIYLVEYPDEKDSEYIKLTPGAERKVWNGIYHLQVYCDDKNLPRKQVDPESKGTLLYDEMIQLPGFTHRSRKIQLDSVYIQHYEIQVTPLGYGYLLEKPSDKVIIKTRF
jgi:hypothetical protein